MIYKKLGKTGLNVSMISLGNMTMTDLSKINQYFPIIEKALDLGINYFDTAEEYGCDNSSEKILGQILKEINVPREEIVISTKIFWKTRSIKNNFPNTIGLSRKHIIEGCLNSLKCLQLDYVDILFAHRYDYSTPLEETCRAFNYLINEGLCFYWGTSEWNPDQIQNAMKICEKLGLIGPSVEQLEYNMLKRENFESKLSGIFDDFQLGSTVYSPLGMGILSGKYNERIPENSRFADFSFKEYYYDNYFDEKTKDSTVEKLKKLEKIAEKDLNCTLSQLAYAWVLYNKDVSTAILGATNIKQIEENVKSIEFYKKFTSEIEEKIEKILENRPNPGINNMTGEIRKFRR